MNKVFRNFLIIIFIILIAVQAIGCGEADTTLSNQNEKVKKLVMWKFKSDKEDYIIYDWIKEWNKEHPDIQVELELIPFSDYLVNKLPTSFATNSAPDIYMVSAGSFLKYAKANAMMPLDKYMGKSLINDFYTESIQAVTYNSSILGIPIEREPVALYYNKKVFEGNKISPPRNWDELLKDAKLLNSNKMSGIFIPTISDDYQSFIFYQFLVQANDGILDYKTNLDKFAASAKKALQLWRELKPYNYDLETVIQGENDIDTFATGKAAMQICGYWSVNALKKYYPDIDYGVIPLPTLQGHDSRSVYGGWYQAVNPKSKYKDEAAEFTVWMWGKDLERPAEWCTEASSKFPTRKSVMEYKKDVYDQGGNAMFKNQIMPTTVPEPRYPAEVSKIISQSIQDALFTDKDINAISEDMKNELKNYLAQNSD